VAQRCCGGGVVVMGDNGWRWQGGLVLGCDGEERKMGKGLYGAVEK
jgi:hypothetical protein